MATPSAELAEKARAFEHAKPDVVVKMHPELAQAFGVVEAAKKFAEANLSEAVRDEFISLARRHVMQKILAGEQVKGPKVYMAPPKTKDSADQTWQRPQRSRDIDKAPRARE